MKNTVGPRSGELRNDTSNQNGAGSDITASVGKPVAGRELRDLKAKAQRLKPLVRLGKEGISEPFLAALEQTLNDHQLVKLKFDEFKDQKKELAPALAARVRAQIIMRVGNVLVLFRRKAEAGAHLETTRDPC